MTGHLVGRTNLTLPSIWLRLTQPAMQTPEARRELVQAAVASGSPIDVSSGPVIWGHALAGLDPFLVCFGSAEYLNCPDESTAADRVQAELLQILSALGRETLDLFVLPAPAAPEEFQIVGALEALEAVRQQGNLRFSGLASTGSPYAALSAWQFHDAFEVLVVPRNHFSDDAYQVLHPLAKERRVGVVTNQPFDGGHGLPILCLAKRTRLADLALEFCEVPLAQAVLADLCRDHPVMAGVRTPEEVSIATSAPGVQVPDGLATWLKHFRKAWEDESNWIDLVGSEDLKSESLPSGGGRTDVD